MKVTVDLDLLDEIGPSKALMFSYLLVKPYATVPEMADDLRLTQHSITMGLRDLEARGFIELLKLKNSKGTDKLVGARILKR